MLCYTEFTEDEIMGNYMQKHHKTKLVIFGCLCVCVCDFTNLHTEGNHSDHHLED